MAGHGDYTSEYLARITDAGVVKQVSARLWELQSVRERNIGTPFHEWKASEYDRICAEAEMRGLL